MCWNEAKVLQTEPNTTYRKLQGISPKVSAGPTDQSTQFGLLSHLERTLSQQNSENYISVKCGLSGKICFSHVGTIRSISSLQ
jgi:hypothetical protein